MFEKASRLKLRFATPQGLITVEDLWDLPLTSKTGQSNLDNIAQSLYKQLQAQDNMSFVKPQTEVDSTVQLGFDVVRHVITVKLAERDAKTVAEANRQKKQAIMAIIAQKENEQLAGSSLDELKKMVEGL